MSSLSRKRLRDDRAAPWISATSAPHAADDTPPSWHHAAASVGVSGADAFLVHLGQSIATALHSSREAAEVARAQLRGMRSAVHSAVDARFDELVACVDTTEETKTVALERELVAVDAALERWRTEPREARDAGSALTGKAENASHPTMSCGLGDIEAQLQALPTSVVEPPLVGLLTDAPALLQSIAVFGHILAPLAITAADLVLDGVPSSVRLGNAVRFRLSLGARHADQSAEELAVSLNRLAEATLVEATLEGPDVVPQPLHVTIAPDVAQRCLLILLEIPLCSSHGSTLNISRISVLGQPVPCPQQHKRIPAFRSVLAPLQLTLLEVDFITAPCITLEGRIYCPIGDSLEVLVFDSDGSPLPGLPVASLGLSHGTNWAAYAHGVLPCLLLADCIHDSSCLVAVDPATRVVRWTSGSKNLHSWNGIATLPHLGMVVAFDAQSIVALRLSDGIHLGRISVPGVGMCLAADPGTETLYGSVKSGETYTVHAWGCTADVSGIRISSNQPATDAGVRQSMRLFAVVPPATGKMVSHLVVGHAWSSELLVLSLPSLALVHTHILKGMQIGGLAADPTGDALAVCDGALNFLHVLAWPLPGMPPLQ